MLPNVVLDCAGPAGGAAASSDMYARHTVLPSVFSDMTAAVWAPF